MKAEPFTEKFKFPGAGKTVEFTADSYRNWTKENVPEEVSRMKEGDTLTIGKYTLTMKPFPTMTAGRKLIIPMLGIYGSDEENPVRSQLKLHRGTSVAWCQFTERVGIPVLSYGPASLGEIWMSLTPNRAGTTGKRKRRNSWTGNGMVCTAMFGKTKR